MTSQIEKLNNNFLTKKITLNDDFNKNYFRNNKIHSSYDCTQIETHQRDISHNPAEYTPRNWLFVPYTFAKTHISPKNWMWNIVICHGTREFVREVEEGLWQGKKGWAQKRINISYWLFSIWLYFVKIWQHEFHGFLLPSNLLSGIFSRDYRIYSLWILKGDRCILAKYPWNTF